MNWIISCNTNDYDIFMAFDEFKTLIWHKQRALSSSKEGDNVYIYCGKPYSKIMFKCQIIGFLSKDECVETDKKYWKNYEKIKTSEEYMELKLLEKFDMEELSLDNLKKEFNYNPQWPKGYETTDEMIKYIEKNLQSRKMIKISNQEDIKNFWKELKVYLEQKINFSKILKIEKPNQNWMDINLLPANDNKEAHIVLRIVKEKFKIEYYIEHNKTFFKYLVFRKKEIELGNSYIWDECFECKCSKIYKEKDFSEFNNLSKVYKWYFKEIMDIYNIFPYYLREFFKEELEEKSEEEYLEGKRKEQKIMRIERSSSAREKCIEIKGTTCQICGMNFEKKYGEVGKNFIEVYHIKPINEVDEEYIVDPKDLIPVCSNCHSMLHRNINGKKLSVEELVKLIKNK